ncbi:MAG: hypothetical protein II679_00585, partial [Ruminococcus sp.]|nr:hypothetical protein [Ruminococcus sp.]
ITVSAYNEVKPRRRYDVIRSTITVFTQTKGLFTGTARTTALCDAAKRYVSEAESVLSDYQLHLPY